MNLFGWKSGKVVPFESDNVHLLVRPQFDGCRIHTNYEEGVLAMRTLSSDYEPDDQLMLRMTSLNPKENLTPTLNVEKIQQYTS